MRGNERGEEREGEVSSLSRLDIKIKKKVLIVYSLRRTFLSCGQAPVSSWQLPGPRGLSKVFSIGFDNVWECWSLRLLLYSFLFSFSEQVPTPEGKQHGGGHRGQNSIWAHLLPTDLACQSRDLVSSAMLRGAQTLLHLGLTLCQVLGAEAVIDRGPFPPASLTGYQCAAHVLEDPPPVRG